MKATRPRNLFTHSDELSRWISLYDLREVSLGQGRRWAIFQAYAKKRAAKRMSLCLNLVDEYRGLRVLDVACGGGHYGAAVAKRGATWIGMDLSFGMLAFARRLLGRHKQCSHLVNADIAQLPFSKESFDVIFCVGILSYFTDHELYRIVRQFPGLLRPGGMLILQTLRLDIITWLRSRFPYWVPRPIRLPGPLYAREANRIINTLKKESLYLSKRIEMMKMTIVPFQTICLFKRPIINSDASWVAKDA